MNFDNVTIMQKIKSISAGKNHILLLSFQSIIFSLGNNDHG